MNFKSLIVKSSKDFDSAIFFLNSTFSWSAVFLVPRDLIVSTTAAPMALGTNPIVLKTLEAIELKSLTWRAMNDGDDTFGVMGKLVEDVIVVVLSATRL